MMQITTRSYTRMREVGSGLPTRIFSNADTARSRTSTWCTSMGSSINSKHISTEQTPGGSSKYRPRKQRFGKHHRKLLRDNRHRYDDLLESQGGGCAICGKKPSENRRLDMDHE